MNPDKHLKSHYDYFKDLVKGDDASTEAHRKFYDEYNAVLDMDADYYLDTIRIVFQDFALVNGTWDVKNPEGAIERVRPQDIKTTAIFTVEGEFDDISGAGQSEAALGMCSQVPDANKAHLDVKGAGHYGIFSGRRWRDVVYPQLKAFILAHRLVPQKAVAPAAAKPAAIPAGKVVAKPVAKKAAAKAPKKVAPKK
jgi:poly(3-hydroxybutyrate) depolymerase